jgi:hypothetical protein
MAVASSGILPRQVTVDTVSLQRWFGAIPRGSATNRPAAAAESGSMAFWQEVVALLESAMR